MFAYIAPVETAQLSTMHRKKGKRGIYQYIKKHTRAVKQDHTTNHNEVVKFILSDYRWCFIQISQCFVTNI